MHKKISDIARDLGVSDANLELRGHNSAKVSRGGGVKNSKLVLVTATNPTPFGEGKTTISIALSDALCLLNKKSCLSLREPSLGPVFGMKGGATGGGLASLENADKINLHFNGDFHAITSANNLIVSIIDDHIYRGNVFNIDSHHIYIRRCFDVNDRALRNVNLGTRDESFVITAASDLMAVLCMCRDLPDLRSRLMNTVVAKNKSGGYIMLSELECVDAVLSLLVDAIQPNLVSTLSGNPAFVHGGPFANIALGCSSVIGTMTALSYADIVVTEAGFGSDLGAEKFIDIQSRLSGIPVDCVVLVSTIRSIRYNGQEVADEEQGGATQDSLQLGIKNLERHIHNIKSVFTLPVVVALNRFSSDTDDEINFVTKYFDEDECKVLLCEPYTKGGNGALDLAREVSKILSQETTSNKATYAYELNSTIEEKIKNIATKVYGAGNVLYSEEAKEQISAYSKSSYAQLPVCIAKTQYSFSDDPKLLGAPKDFDFTVKSVRLNSGAGFFVAVCGSVMVMPGLGNDSRYKKIKVSDDGIISGLL